jgi:hypothetical protein
MNQSTSTPISEKKGFPLSKQALLPVFAFSVSSLLHLVIIFSGYNDKKNGSAKESDALPFSVTLEQALQQDTSRKPADSPSLPRKLASTATPDKQMKTSTEPSVSAASAPYYMPQTVEPAQFAWMMSGEYTYWPREQLTSGAEPVKAPTVLDPEAGNPQIAGQKVDLLVYLDETGKVDKVLSVSNAATLNRIRSAIDSISMTGFEPGKINGLPVKSVIHIQLYFGIPNINPQ